MSASLIFLGVETGWVLAMKKRLKHILPNSCSLRGAAFGIMRTKRYLQWCLSPMVLLMPLVSFALTDGDYTFTVSSGKATITDFNSAYNGDLTVATTLGGYPVTYIGASAFSRCYQLREVTIPNGILDIDDGAFYSCTNMTCITVSRSVIYIGRLAFSHCDKLTTAYFNGNAPTIGDLTCTTLFDDPSKVTVYTLPGTTGWPTVATRYHLVLKSLPFTYIKNNNNTVTVTGSTVAESALNIPKNIADLPVTSISDQAFDGNTAITSVTIPCSVTNIGWRAFASCSGLKHVTINSDGGDVGVIGNLAFCECNSLTSCAISNGITYIGEYVFSSCSSLADVIIPNKLRTIQRYTFSGCRSLKKVIIPDSVTKMMEYAFYACIQLEGVFFRGNAPTSTFGEFSNQTNSTLYRLSRATGWPTVPELWCGRPTALWDLPVTVTFNATGGVVNPVNKSVAFDTAYGELPEPAWVGHTFMGWLVVTNGVSFEVTSNSVVAIYADHTLNANWTVNSYTVTFDAAGGTVTPGDKIVTYSAAYGTLPSATRMGYMFDGWWTGPNGTGTHVTSSTIVTSSDVHTLYASWTVATTEQGIPYLWLDRYGLVSGGNYEAAAQSDADGDGHVAWQEYVAGTEPTNIESVLRALIAISNGVPRLAWSPDLGTARVYTVTGKTNVTDTCWGPTNAGCRFFRVGVSLP